MRALEVSSLSLWEGRGDRMMGTRSFILLPFSIQPNTDVWRWMDPELVELSIQEEGRLKVKVGQDKEELTQSQVEQRCAAADGEKGGLSDAISIETHHLSLLMFLASAISFPVTVPRIKCQMEGKRYWVGWYAITSPICSQPLGLFSCRIKD